MASSRTASDSGAGNSKTHGNPALGKEPNFIRLHKKEFPAFYRQFLLPRPEPVFVDIYDPLPFPTLKQFISYFSGDKFWIRGRPSSPVAYLALHDSQREHALANLDFMFFDGYPRPDSTPARVFQDFVGRCIADCGLTRVQTFVLASSTAKIDLLESFGFRKEGVLREHFFHNSRLHDVAVHAWMAEGRRG